MNIFTNLLFLQGHLVDTHLFDEDDDRFSSYGNRAASEKFFAPLGHARGKERNGNEPQLDACATVDGCA
jgi:hypothetical protein